MFEPKRYHIESRAEFERILNRLVEAMRNGRVKFSSETEGIKRMENSFLRVRELPNKRIDFSTVDEQVRTTANALTQTSMNTSLENEEE